MLYLKQSTASQAVLIGPCINDTDGKTAETGLTIAASDIRLSKNGANIAAKNSGGGTHDELGYYTITLDATDTNTVGRLQLMVQPTGALPVYHEFWVLEEAVYDALFAASAPGYVANAPVNVAQFGGSNLTSASGIPEVKVNNIAANAITATAIATGAITNAKFAAGAIDAAAIANNAIDAATFAADVDAEILSYLVDDATRIDASALNTLSGHDPGETIMGATDLGTGSGLTSLATAAELAKVPKSDSNVTWNATAAAQIQSEANDALVAYDPPTKAELDSAVSPLATSVDLGTVDMVVDAIKVTTDKLDDTLEDDSGTYRFTENALEEAPTGGSAPTAGEIADAVWEEALADHEGTAGSTAEALADAGGSGASASDIADAVLDEALAGHTSAGTLGKAVADILEDTSTTLDDLVDNLESRLGTPSDLGSGATIAANLVDIEAQTDDIGAAGAGLTVLATAAELAKVPKSDSTVGWNATARAQIQQEAEDALAAYDPPTKAELDSGLDALPTAAEVVNEWESQSQADPTGFHVNVLEWTGNAVTASSGNPDVNVESMDADVIAAATLASDVATEIWAAGTRTLTAIDEDSTTIDIDAAIRAALGMSSANLDTQLGDLPTAAENFTAVLTSALTEAYAADGAAPTLAQAIFLIMQRLTEFAISGTTVTVKKLDGSTTAATLTLDDDTSPTSSTRAS